MTRHSTIFALAFLAAITCALPRASGQESPSPPATAPARQIYCPLAPDVEIDPEVFTEYKGQRIYFCCDRCRVRFLRDPESYAGRSAGAISQATRPSDEGRSREHEHVHSNQPAPHSAAPEQTKPDHDHVGTAVQPTSVDHPGEHASGADHEHSGQEHAKHQHDHGPKLLIWLGRFHPAMVNFPIGVLFSGALAELLFVLRKSGVYDHVARFCVAFAALTGLVAGVLGWFFGGFHLPDTDWLLATHRWLGTGTVLWLLVLWRLSERARRHAGSPRRLYHILLFGGAVLVAVQGFFGGAMVYGINHYMWP